MKVPWYKLVIWRIHPLRILNNAVLSRIAFFITTWLPGKRTMRDRVIGGIWVVIVNGRLQTFDRNGNKISLNVKRGAWKLRPSINTYTLNELTTTLYVNIAQTEEEMLKRIADQNKSYGKSIREKNTN
jgi:hypothetical protein